MTRISIKLLAVEAHDIIRLSLSPRRTTRPEGLVPFHSAAKAVQLPMLIRFLCCFICLAGTMAIAQQIPPELVGKWVIKRELPTTTISCWDDKQAKAIIGTQIVYNADSFAWNNNTIKTLTVEVALVTAQKFHDDNSGAGANDSQVSFLQLGISAPRVKQVTIDHSPADITGMTEIPGDVVWLKNRNTIVLSVCNLYFEARRIGK